MPLKKPLSSCCEQSPPRRRQAGSQSAHHVRRRSAIWSHQSAPTVLGANRDQTGSGRPIDPRIHLFVRRRLPQGRTLHVSDHADFEHRLLPDLPRCAGTKVRSTGYPSRARWGSQPSVRRADRSGHITLLYLPPYSPELNPKESIWDEIREKVFKNYALKSIAAVYAKLEQAILYIERNPKLVRLSPTHSDVETV